MKRNLKKFIEKTFSPIVRRAPVFSVLLFSATIVLPAAPISAAPETANSRNFFNVLDDVLIRRGWTRKVFCDGGDVIANRIVRDYGSLFVAQNTVALPSVCIFENAEAVEKFQTETGFVKAEIAGTLIELQRAAMESLIKARVEAGCRGFDITARDGAEAARRTYADTLRLWKTRFEPACRHWKKRGKLSAAQIERLESLPIREQVTEVLKLEAQGIYFNTFFNRSILYSVAAPGASQHLSMLAFDANEFDNIEVRKILARHGWFRTVKNDEPHFTFLGLSEERLSAAGLRKISTNTGEYWIPDV